MFDERPAKDNIQLLNGGLKVRRLMCSIDGHLTIPKSLNLVDENFSRCYHLYYGCGNHLFAFTNDVSLEELNKIYAADPKAIAEKWLAEAIKIAPMTIVQQDAEMGGIGVLEPYNEL